MSNRSNHRCGCGDHRPRGCLNSIGGAHRWPCYNISCPDVSGEYEEEERCKDRCRDRDDDCDDRRERRCRGRRRGMISGIFTASIPTAVAANGIIPLSGNCLDPDWLVNGGVINLESPGTYLATVTARVPEGVTMDTTVTLNANDASQYPALMVLCGEGPTASSAQAIFDVCDRTAVSLRSSEALNITAASPQPLFTLSLVKLEE